MSLLSFINKHKILFPSLQQLNVYTLKDYDLETHCSHIDAYIEDMIKQFKDLQELLIPAWLVYPFYSDVENVRPNLKEPFIELQNDCDVKIISNQCDYNAIWGCFRHQYPLLLKELNLPNIALPSPYLVEKGFSAVLRNAYIEKITK